MYIFVCPSCIIASVNIYIYKVQRPRRRYALFSSVVVFILAGCKPTSYRVIYLNISQLVNSE